MACSTDQALLTHGPPQIGVSHSANGTLLYRCWAAQILGPALPEVATQQRYCRPPPLAPCLDAVVVRDRETGNVLSASYGTLADVADYISIGIGDDMDSNIKRIIGIALLIIGAWVVYDGTTTGETLTIVLGAASVVGGFCFLFIRPRRVT